MKEHNYTWLDMVMVDMKFEQQMSETLMSQLSYCGQAHSL